MTKKIVLEFSDDEYYEFQKNFDIIKNCIEDLKWKTNGKDEFQSIQINTNLLIGIGRSFEAVKKIEKLI